METGFALEEYEDPRPSGRGIFSRLFRRERNPSEAEISLPSSTPPTAGRFSAKGDKTLDEARRRKKQLKGWTRKKKEKLIKGEWGKWQ